MLDVGIIASHPFVALVTIGGVSFLNFFQGNFFRSIVFGSDLVGTLECHVLKHVSEAGLTHRILHRASVHVSEEGEYRRFGTLADKHGQAIRQFLDRGPLFK